MPLLVVTGRNTLFDDAKVLALQQVPTFATATPSVAFRGRNVRDVPSSRRTLLPFSLISLELRYEGKIGLCDTRRHGSREGWRP